MVNINAELCNPAARRFMETFEAPDDAFAEAFDPDVVWHPIEENRMPLHGIEAAVRNRNAWLDTWEEHRVDVDEVVEDGDDVVVSVHIRARGKGSGLETDLLFYVQMRARDGKLVYIYDHEERAAAL